MHLCAQNAPIACAYTRAPTHAAAIMVVCVLEVSFVYVSVCGPDFDIAKKAILKIYSLYISIVYSSILMLQKHLGLFVEIDIFINGLGKLLL